MRYITLAKLIRKLAMEEPELIKVLSLFTEDDWKRIAPNYDISIKIKMKKVRNLLSGIEVEIPVDTPYYMDPSSETYHSS